MCIALVAVLLKLRKYTLLATRSSFQGGWWVFISSKVWPYARNWAKSWGGGGTLSRDYSTSLFQSKVCDGTYVGKFLWGVACSLITIAHLADYIHYIRFFTLHVWAYWFTIGHTCYCTYLIELHDLFVRIDHTQTATVIDTPNLYGLVYTGFGLHCRRGLVYTVDRAWSTL